MAIARSPERFPVDSGDGADTIAAPMFRQALKRYAAIDIRPRVEDQMRHDFFVHGNKFATLYMAPRPYVDGCAGVYKTAKKEFILRYRDDGLLYVEIDGHRTLKLLPENDGRAGHCRLAHATYSFAYEDSDERARLLARLGKALAFSFKPATAEGERAIAVGNCIIESADLHPLLSILAHHAITRDMENSAAIPDTVSIPPGH
jgi:hypothetical protein